MTLRRGLMQGSVTLAMGLALAAFVYACGGGGGTPAADADVLGDTSVPETVETEVQDTSDRDTSGDAETATETVDPIALDLVASGKELLSAGESLAAMDTFDRALELAPGLPDALWGRTLARFQSSVAMFGSLAGLLNFKHDPDSTGPDLAPRAWVSHPGTVGANVDALHSAAILQKQRLQDLMALPQTPVFHLEGGLPLAFGDHPMMSLCCSWDRSELHGISAFNEMMLTLVELLGSQDTQVQLLSLERMAKERGLTATLAGMLVENPTLMTLMANGGAETWRSMKDSIAAAADATLAAADLMAQDNGLEDNVATLTLDDHPHLVLHGAFPGGATELEILWDGQAASLKDTVLKVQAHLAGDASRRLTLEGDVLVALGTLVDLLNRTVGIATIASSLGFDLPDLLTGLLDSLDPEDPEQLVSLLGSLLPAVGIANGTVQFDLLAFVGSPFSLRDLFPNWGTVPDSPWPGFLKSYECLKGGATLTPGDATNLLALTLHDPSAAQAPASLAVSSFATPDGTGEAFDTEAVVPTATEGFTGVFTATVAVTTGDAPGSPGDGALVVPAGG